MPYLDPFMCSYSLLTLTRTGWLIHSCCGGKGLILWVWPQSCAPDAVMSVLGRGAAAAYGGSNKDWSSLTTDSASCRWKEQTLGMSFSYFQTLLCEQAICIPTKIHLKKHSDILGNTRGGNMAKILFHSKCNSIFSINSIQKQLKVTIMCHGS